MDDRRGEWAHGVDENLASLNSGQRSQDDRLRALDEAQKDADALIHGETDSGLIGRIEDLEADVIRLMAVIFQDASGTKGLHHDIQMVLEGREDRRLGWGNITKILVALIMAGLVGRFYSDIWALVDQKKAPAAHVKKHKRLPEPEPEEP